MKAFMHEFKEFIARGNVIDLAVGLVIGAAFQKIVTSLVNDVVFPAITPALNVANFSAWKLGSVMIGSFIQAIVDFIIVAFFIFLVVKFTNRFRKKAEKEAPTPQDVVLLTEIRDLLKNKA